VLLAVPSTTLSSSDQLNYIYKTDQGDRLALQFIKLNESDQERIQQVVKILEQDEILSPESLYQTAIILQHGTGSEHYEMAYILTKQANELGYRMNYGKLLMTAGCCF